MPFETSQLLQEWVLKPMIDLNGSNYEEKHKSEGAGTNKGHEKLLFQGGRSVSFGKSNDHVHFENSELGNRDKYGTGHPRIKLLMKVITYHHGFGGNLSNQRCAKKSCLQTEIFKVLDADIEIYKVTESFILLQNHFSKQLKAGDVVMCFILCQVIRPWLKCSQTYHSKPPLHRRRCSSLARGQHQKPGQQHSLSFIQGHTTTSWTR